MPLSVKRSPWPALALAALLAAPALGAQAATCPATLLERPTALRQEKSWTVVTRAAERPLESVGVYLGPQSELDAQVPTSTTKAGRTERVRWDIARAQGDRFWLGCSYTGTTALAVREVGRDVRRCTVTYDLLPSGRRQRVRSVDCR